VKGRHFAMTNNTWLHRAILLTATATRRKALLP